MILPISHFWIACDGVVVGRDGGEGFDSGGWWWIIGDILGRHLDREEELAVAVESLVIAVGHEKLAVAVEDTGFEDRGIPVAEEVVESPELLGCQFEIVLEDFARSTREGLASEDGPEQESRFAFHPIVLVVPENVNLLIREPEWPQEAQSSSL